MPDDLAVRCRKALNSTQYGDWLAASVDLGVPTAHLLAFASQPTAGNTLGIGSDVYEFVSSVDGEVANAANIAVTIGASAASTRANLVAAINAVTTGNRHPTAVKPSSEEPAKANGTALVRADQVSTNVVVTTADRPGGTPTGTDASIAVSENIAAAGVVWTYGNVNFNTLGGHAPGKAQGEASVVITAAMITAGSYVFRFPFTPARFMFQVRSSAGVQRAATDAFVASAAGVTVTLAGGASPAIQATDIVTVFASE